MLKLNGTQIRYSIFIIGAMSLCVLEGAFADELSVSPAICCGHPTVPPAITDGLDFSATVLTEQKQSQRWTAHLQQHFPVGSSVESLQDALRQQGFQIYQPRRTASYDWGGMPCLFTLTVEWTEDKAHRLASVGGHSRTGCL
jgi:hypothetical protein